MKKFIQTRLDWIENQFLPLPKATLKSGPNGASAELTAAAGEIVFTLDGSDPRASGGGISKTAQVYKTPLSMSHGAKLFARMHQENRWSGPLVWKE